MDEEAAVAVNLFIMVLTVRAGWNAYNNAIPSGHNASFVHTVTLFCPRTMVKPKCYVLEASYHKK